MSDKANWIGTTEIDAGDVQHTGTHRFDGGSKFVIVDPTDSTKSVIFNVSGLPTGTQTEFTVPDSDSSLVTLSATQTLTNKTLTAPVITGATIGVIDNVFTIADNTTPTKIATFQCSGLTAGTNVFTFPDTAADTLVTLDVAQTLTNKTLTSPVLGGTTTGTNIAVTSTGDLDLTASGGTGDTTITAGRNTDITSSNGYLSLTSTTGGDISLINNGSGKDIVLTAASNGSDVYVNAGLRLQRTTTASSVSTTWRPILGVTSNASQRTVTLEADTNSDGHIVIVKDEAGTAGTANSIIVTPESGTIDGAANDTILSNYGSAMYYGTGTNWFTLFSTKRAAQTYVISAANNSKVGTDAGWVVAPVNNLALVTLPASQTGSDLVVGVTGLKVGWIITGFFVIGQIESAGNHATLDADLRVLTAVAADVTDASLGAITQLDVVADTAVTSANTTKTLAAAHTILGTETFYVLISGTTDANTDIALQGLGVIVTET